MPTSPDRQKRRSRRNHGAANLINEKIDEFQADHGIDKAAQLLGRRGGQARTKALTANRRKEIARTAAQARWKR